MEYDIKVITDGTFIGFIPVTTRGRNWFDTHVEYKPYNTLGNTIYADPRYGSDIIAGGNDDGIRFGVEG